MSARPFEITVTGRVLRGTLRGYWDMATAEDYVAELTWASNMASPLPTHWLIDVSSFPVQAGDVADWLARGVDAAKRSHHPIVAIVGNSALGALQGRRVAQNDPHAFFASLAEAEAWLGKQVALDP